MINPGTYKGKAVKGSVQVGETDKGTLQVAIDINVLENGQSLGEMTTFLYFSDGAAPYSYERLRALGWDGKGPEDIDKMDKIDTNEVDVRVTQAETYKAADGTTKQGSSKLEILTGGGKVVLAKPLDMGTFKARLKAIGGSSSGSGGTTQTPDNKPPF